MDNKQTPVEWLIKQLHEHDGHIDVLDVASLNGYWDQAKQMERERRKEDFKIGYNQGYMDAQVNHINDADNAANEHDYLNQ